MTGLEGTLSNARGRISSMRFWCDQIVANYDVYAADHGDCIGYVDVRPDLALARDDVRTFATTLETRVDASGWVTEIGDRSTGWNQAASHVSDAIADVSATSLRAYESWKGGASPRYRAAVQPQRDALLTVHEAYLDMKQGCTSAETAGVTHFESVESLAAALVGSLSYSFDVRGGFGTQYGNGGNGTLFTTPPPVYGPQSPVQQSEGPGYICPVGSLHVTAGDITSRFVTPLTTAKTALTSADDQLRTSITNAFSEPAGGPRNIPPEDLGRVTIAQRLGEWPTVGAGA